MLDELEPKKSGPRSRVREADFMRIEDSAIRDPLSPFELEVKGRLASAKSPLESLLEDEEHLSRKQALKEQRKKLKKLLRKLGVRQQQYFKFFYSRHRKDKEIALKLGISESRVRVIRWSLKTSFINAAKRDQSKEVLKRSIKYKALTKPQKRVWKLYAEKGLSPLEIAQHLGCSKRAVNRILARIKNKISKEKRSHL